jgi:hypothetical protein
MGMNEITKEYGVLAPNSQPARRVAVRGIWPAAAIAFGLGLTAAWICFLGYGLVKLVDLVI